MDVSDHCSIDWLVYETIKTAADNGISYENNITFDQKMIS